MRGILTRLGASALCVLAVSPAVASAHGRATLDAPLVPVTLSQQERASLALETSLIGREHALQHLHQRRGPEAGAAQAPPSGPGPGFDPCRPRGPANEPDFSRPLPPEGRPTGQARCSKLPRQPSARERPRRGRWTRDVMDLPHYAIHAALMPTGKVLFWGFEWTQNIITRQADSHQGTTSIATVWNPRKGTGPSAFKPVPAPMADVDGDGEAEFIPLYCSGQTLLADGRVLVTGGTLDLRWAEKGYTNPPGLRIVLIFDPRTETWTRVQDMSVARWYPTQLKLADGRTLVLGGYADDKPTSLTGTMEIVSRDGSTVTHLPSADRTTWTYPGMLLMPSGRVLLAGPLKEDSGILEPRTMRWGPLRDLPAHRAGTNLVPVPTRTGISRQALLIGGLDFVSALRDGGGRAYRTSLLFDERRRSAGWRPAPSQRRPRNWPNTVLLPDGAMLTVGGGTAMTRRDASFATEKANRRVELWDPKTRRWRLGAEQREDRTYHSVALLLPDGRVWSAGDDGNPNRDGDTGEIYEPPYLFKGRRPRIASAPTRIAPRRPFTMNVRGPVPERVTLLAPAATTHGLDMNQRFVELKILRSTRTARGTRLRVRGPRGLNAAPPGPWMLFAVSERGAPSVARWTTVR